MEQERQQKPNYAVRVMVFKDGKILLGKSKGTYSKGESGPPGGHLEYMESFEDCVKRETLEECGVEITNIKFLAIANNKENAPYHNIHIMLTADWKNGEPKVLEPEKIESWNWYDLNDLPKPLWKNCELALESYKTGKNYFDAK